MEESKQWQAMPFEERIIWQYLCKLVGNPTLMRTKEEQQQWTLFEGYLLPRIAYKIRVRLNNRKFEQSEINNWAAMTFGRILMRTLNKIKTGKIKEGDEPIAKLFGAASINVLKEILRDERIIKRPKTDKDGNTELDNFTIISTDELKEERYDSADNATIADDYDISMDMQDENLFKNVFSNLSRAERENLLKQRAYIGKCEIDASFKQQFPKYNDFLKSEGLTDNAVSTQISKNKDSLKKAITESIRKKTLFDIDTITAFIKRMLPLFLLFHI